LRTRLKGERARRGCFLRDNLPLYSEAMGRDNVDESKLILCNGCICCNNALYTEFPACLGCSGEYKIICLECDWCVKLNTPTKRCICCNIDITKNYFNPIIKGQDQYFCCVDSCALPPGGEVPMTLGLYGIFCYPSFGLCKTQGQLVMNRA